MHKTLFMKTRILLLLLSTGLLAYSPAKAQSLARVTGNSTRYITADGKIMSCGENAAGSLGNGNQADVYTPVDISQSGALAGKVIVMLAAGDVHGAAIDSAGKIYTWGHNGYGQLGNGTFNDRLLPDTIIDDHVLAGKKAIYIAAGNHNTFIVADDHRLYGWGWNYFGMLGDGYGNSSDDYNTTEPVAVDTTGVLAGKDMVAVSPGLWHTLGLDAEGHVYAWGINEAGQLGCDTVSSEYINIPVPVDTTGVLKGKKIIDIYAGCYFSMALDDQGHVYTWGENEHGQLGNNTTRNSFVPVAVDTNGVLKGKKIIAIAAGDEHALVLDDQGVLYSWGLNDHGQLGNLLTGYDTIPRRVYMEGVLKDKKIIKITCGDFHSAVMDEEGNVYTWGLNDHGQLGIAGIPESHEPLLIGTSLPAGHTGFKEDFDDLNNPADTALWTWVLGEQPEDNNISGSIKENALRYKCDPNKSYRYSVWWKFNRPPYQNRYFDLHEYPYLSFLVKVEPGARLNGKELDLVDIGVDIPGAGEYLNKQVPDDGQWHRVYYVFDEKNPIYRYITDIRIHPGITREDTLSPGFTGTIWIDGLRIGDKVEFPQELTTIRSFTEDFSRPVDMGFWIPNKKTFDDGTPLFFVLQQEEALRIEMKQQQYTDGQMYDFTQLGYLLDLTAHPKARMRIRVEPGALLAGLETDTIPFSLSPFSSDYSKRDSIVYPYAQQHAPVTVDVPADGEWHDCLFDWSIADEAPAEDGYVYPNDYQKITYLLLETRKEPGACYEATFWLDDVVVGEAVDNPTALPEQSGSGYRLWQNYPNPVSRNTTIRYELPKTTYIHISLLDITGKEVAVLVEGIMPAGRHSLSFHRSDLQEGIYFYKLETDDFTAVKKMILTGNEQQ